MNTLAVIRAAARAVAGLFAVLVMACGLSGCIMAPPSMDHSYDATWPEEVSAGAPADGSINHAGNDIPLFEN